MRRRERREAARRVAADQDPGLTTSQEDTAAEEATVGDEAVTAAENVANSNGIIAELPVETLAENDDA